jgi:hypothetical protein
MVDAHFIALLLLAKTEMFEVCRLSLKMEFEEILGCVLYVACTRLLELQCSSGPQQGYDGKFRVICFGNDGWERIFDLSLTNEY